MNNSLYRACAHAAMSSFQMFITIHFYIAITYNMSCIYILFLNDKHKTKPSTCTYYIIIVTLQPCPQTLSRKNYFRVHALVHMQYWVIKSVNVVPLCRAIGLIGMFCASSDTPGVIAVVHIIYMYDYIILTLWFHIVSSSPLSLGCLGSIQ